MNILFLDTARKTGYCIYDGSKHRIAKVGNWKLEIDREEMSLYNRVAEIIELENIGHIVSEDIYRDPDKKGVYQKLCGYRAVILMASQVYNLPAPYFMNNIKVKQILFEIAGPKAVERALSLKGIEGKETVMRKVKSYGYTPATYDEADALMLAIAYLEIYRFPLTHPEV